MPMRFSSSGQGPVKLNNSSVVSVDVNDKESSTLYSPRGPRSSWNSQKEAVSRLPALTTISDDDEITGCCVVPSPRSSKRPFTKAKMPIPRDETFETDIYSHQSEMNLNSLEIESLPLNQSMPSLALTNRRSAAPPHHPITFNDARLIQKNDNKSRSKNEAVFSINVDTWDQHARTFGTEASNMTLGNHRSNGDERGVAKRDHSTDSNYYSELSREENNTSKPRREIIRCGKVISGHKLREYQRNNHCRMSSEDRKLFQFTIAQVEQVQPRQQLRDAELIMYSSDPVNGCNVVFQSGSRRNKFLSIWQTDETPQFIQRTSPSGFSYQKFWITFGIIFLIAFISCYCYVLVASVVDVITQRLATSGININLDNRGLLTLRMLLLSDNKDPYAATGFIP